MEKYTIGLYEKAMPGTLSWQEKLEAAKKAGFDYIEISIDETDEKLARLDMPKAERMMLINTCLVMGMPIRSMCLSGHRKFPIGSNDPAIEAVSYTHLDVYKRQYIYSTYQNRCLQKALFIL